MEVGHTETALSSEGLLLGDKAATTEATRLKGVVTYTIPMQLRRLRMAKEKAKKKAVKKIEKAVRKAVKKGVDKDLVTQAVDQAIVDVSDRKQSKKIAKKPVSAVKSTRKTKRISADADAA
jgi:hypothetical protein